jgi:hypothetical protein
VGAGNDGRPDHADDQFAAPRSRLAHISCARTRCRWTDFTISGRRSPAFRDLHEQRERWTKRGHERDAAPPLALALGNSGRTTRAARRPARRLRAGIAHRLREYGNASAHARDRAPPRAGVAHGARRAATTSRSPAPHRGVYSRHRRRVVRVDLHDMACAVVALVR